MIFIAKKNFHYDNKLIFIKNKEYKITEIHHLSITSYTYFFKCEIMYKTDEYTIDRFSIKKENLYDYFYTTQQLRKIKIKQLQTIKN